MRVGEPMRRLERLRQRTKRHRPVGGDLASAICAPRCATFVHERRHGMAKPPRVAQSRRVVVHVDRIGARIERVGRSTARRRAPHRSTTRPRKPARDRPARPRPASSCGDPMCVRAIASAWPSKYSRHCARATAARSDCSRAATTKRSAVALGRERNREADLARRLLHQRELSLDDDAERAFAADDPIDRILRARETRRCSSRDAAAAARRRRRRR